jgi:hypothetical protein
MDLRHGIVRDHAGSPYAAKSAYTLGWIYEHRLQKSDSALAQYKALVEHFGSTRYAAAVRGRIGTTEAPQDSTVLPGRGRLPRSERMERDSTARQVIDPRKVIE